MNNVTERLHQSVVTASNDDWSEAGTDKRRRHVERLETLRDAVDEIARLTAERDAALAAMASMRARMIDDRDAAQEDGMFGLASSFQAHVNEIDAFQQQTPQEDAK